MKRDFNVMWGVLLIATGVLFLLQSFNVILIDAAWEVVWAGVFGVSGLAFTWRFFSDRTDSWWAAIPGCTLLALAALVGVHTLGFTNNGNEGAWLGAFFLAAISAGFWGVYVSRREFWWAVIPGGVLLTLAAVALLSTWLDGPVVGGILFFGMAVTFGLVSILPTPHGRMVWALIPAGIMVVLGAAMMLAIPSVFNYVWAVALILVGVYLLLRQTGRGEISPRS